MVEYWTIFLFVSLPPHPSSTPHTAPSHAALPLLRFLRIFPPFSSSFFQAIECYVSCYVGMVLWVISHLSPHSSRDPPPFSSMPLSYGNRIFLLYLLALPSLLSKFANMKDCDSDFATRLSRFTLSLLLATSHTPLNSLSHPPLSLPSSHRPLPPLTLSSLTPLLSHSYSSPPLSPPLTRSLSPLFLHTQKDIFDADPFDPKEALRAPGNPETLGLKLESDNEKIIESEEVPPPIKSMTFYFLFFIFYLYFLFLFLLV
jgi:hypothetical protein